MSTEAYIAIATVVLSFLADIISKSKQTKASVAMTAKLAEVVDELKNTVALHSRRLDDLESKPWNTPQL